MTKIPSRIRNANISTIMTIWKQKDIVRRMTGYLSPATSLQMIVNVSMRTKMTYSYFLIVFTDSFSALVDGVSMELDIFAVDTSDLVIIACFDIQEKLLQPVRKDDAYEELQLPEGHKRTLESLVERHFNNKEAVQNQGKKSIDFDFVQGKGLGLIVLLHG